MTASPPPKRIGVLLSGTGRTLENFLEVQERGELPVEFASVISSRGDVRGVDIGRDAGIPTEVLRPRDHPSVQHYGEAIAEVFRSAKVDYVAMAGFLHLWQMPSEFADRVINIHPSLLPAFGGQGFYGSRVHRAVFEAGVHVSGCTVHFADEEYDRGPILLQRAVSIAACRNPDEIASAVFEQECTAYPEALRALVEDRIVRTGNRLQIVTDPVQ